MYEINFFVKKNDTQISGFAVVKKAPSQKFFEKKSYSSLFVQIRSTKRYAEIFLK